MKLTEQKFAALWIRKDTNCDELTIVVANTIAGACASTDYFDKTDIKLIGTYHQNMVKHEKEEMIAPSTSGITLEKI